MAIATDAQVQNFVNTRVRPRCELIRQLVLSLQDDKANISDVYSACAQQSPTWVDNRTDGPPHLLTTSDVLAYNTYITDLITALTGDAQYPVILNACVRSVNG